MDAGDRQNVGARTPEELETLLEDALVLRDLRALATLCETGAICVAGEERPVYGGEAIGRMAMATWNGDRLYLADPRCVLVACDIALVVGEHGINVVHRGSDGAWRYVIRLQQDATDESEREREWPPRRVQSKACGRWPSAKTKGKRAGGLPASR
jgi:hypothetical protein